jgi:hypothetical protein
VSVRASLDALATPSDSLPFWSAANRYGAVDPTSSNLRLGLGASYRGRAGRLRYGAGVQVQARASARSQVWLQAGSAHAAYRGVRLQAGRWRERPAGLVASALSMGSMLRSRNAAPMPKVVLRSEGYRPVPFTGGWLAVKGYYAHGWFESDRFVDSPYLHEKHAYLRMLPERLPVQAHAGLAHAAMWGGTSPNRGRLPQGFGDYLRVVTARSAAGDAPEGEATNVIGNALGLYDFGLTVDLGPVGGRIYRQFYLEDTPAVTFRSPWDGLWGVRLTRAGDGPHVVEEVLWQHLYSKRQDARWVDGDVRGRAHYYYHFIYESGWTFRGRTVGTPLFLVGTEAPGIDNNIVVAHHVGVSGTVAGTDYRLLGTYSRNYGACRTSSGSCPPFPGSFRQRRDQWAFLLRGSRVVHRAGGGRLRVSAGAAVDVGEAYGNRVALEAGLQWTSMLGR